MPKRPLGRLIHQEVKPVALSHKSETARRGAIYDEPASESELDLFNDFTYFLNDPVLGDQFHQHDDRSRSRRE